METRTEKWTIDDIRKDPSTSQCDEIKLLQSLTTFIR